MAALSTAFSNERSCYYRHVAQLGVAIASALHYAHEQGVIHRDIKPSNLMIDQAGKPWITDFGLAHIQGDQTLTLSGDLVGTIRYMSPEQAEGQKLLDHRTDIYSLGLVLYELVTLRPAFDQTDRRALLRQIIEVEPPLPRRIEPSVPKDLQTIILKCIAKQPGDRYASAAELAEDLQRFLEHKPIQARRVGPAYRLLRWTQRNRAVSGLVAVVLVLLCALAVGGPLFAYRYMRMAAREAAARRDLQVVLDRAMTQTAAAVQNAPQMNTLVRDLLMDVARDYDKLLARSGDDPTVRYQAARSYRLLARLYRSPLERRAARELYTKAIAILTPMVEQDPAWHDCQAELAETHRRLGVMCWTSDLVEAENHLRQSVQLAEELVARAPDVPHLSITVTCFSNKLRILSWLVWRVTRGASSAGQSSFRARAIASSRYERFRYWPDVFCKSPFRQVSAGAS